MKAGDLFGRSGRPVVMILRPKGTQRYLLATINTTPGQAPLTKAGLKDCLKGFDRIGAVKAVVLLVLLCGCVTKPKSLLPPMPPVSAPKAKLLAPTLPFAPKQFRITWDEPTENVIFSVVFSSDLTNWSEIGETTNVVFPIVADGPMGFYRIGAKWK